MGSVRRAACIIAILLALVPFTWLAFQFSDLPQFGKYQDDGLLLIAGKSLHAGNGYRIASLPGQPFQTKYQPVYPLLLSMVWSARPRFPENLRAFAILQWAITLAFLAAAYLLFRASGFALGKAAAMVIFLATCPWLIYWSLVPFADIFLSLQVALVFWLLVKHRGDPRWWWVIGCIGAVACLTKVIGILLVPAIWAGGWRRSQWKRNLITTGPMLIAFVAWSAWAALHRAPGQNSVLWYYTDYLAFDLKNGGLTALPQILVANTGTLIATVGNTFLYNLADSTLGRFLSVLVLAAWVSGMRRRYQRDGAPEAPVFCGLLVAVLLAWNFSPNIRLLAPALPFLAMGLCAEGEYLYSLVRSAVRSRQLSNRVAAYIMGGGMAIACLATLVINLNFITHGIPALLEQDRAFAARNRTMRDWLGRTLPQGSVVLASDDTNIYLSTGLQAVRAVPNSVALYKEDTRAVMEEATHWDRLIHFFGITHVWVTVGDLSSFSPAQRQALWDSLDTNPQLRQIYAADDSVVFEVVGPSRAAAVSR